jgi:alpha-amylase/alpha-mannosidase (GH57 family)
MTLRSICIHAHFYQPPREDPLTGIIPPESGSTPYQNWNERIHAECYRPNAELGNFERISFNVGPTLMSWMQAYHPETSSKIVAQDQANYSRHGVGNAMAQAYNHTILPLDSLRDKITQVYWGIADFEQRFGHRPVGMWLPETATDLETLQVLADHGIQFTILAPWQFAEQPMDVSQPYRIALPDGRSIVAFTYHPDLSGGISFNPSLTTNADQFAQQNVAPYFSTTNARRGEPQLIMLASDGELYGHHQPLRNYFLSRLVDGAVSRLGLEVTYPGLWLKRNPVLRSAQLLENTSWSCHHGVKRWLGNCPCSPGDGHWKAQLRYAFERIAASLDQVYEHSLSPYIRDPWQLRNQYIHVILGQRSVEELISEEAGARLPADVLARTHMLLESQRERQRMFTSCGWFFEDFDRIEPKNNVAYAAQAVRLMRMATGVDISGDAMNDLRRVSSQRNGLRADMVFYHHMQRAIKDGRVIAG